MICRTFTLAQARRALPKVGRARRCALTALALRKGMNIEREHADLIGCSPTKAARVAAAHLCERPDYYERLEKYVEPKKRRSRR